jgi:FkbM family methyltransferase
MSRIFGLETQSVPETFLIASTVYGFGGDYNVLPRNIRTPQIIEGGAHIGISVRHLKQRHPGAIIDAFEPDPRNYRLLAQNVGGMPGIRLHQLALGRTEGKAALYLGNNFTWGDNLVKPLYRNGQETIEVSTIPLSSVVNGRVDLLKLDIEGMEAVVLQELVDTDPRKLRVCQHIVAEWHSALVPPKEFDDTLKMLRQHGFDVRCGLIIRRAYLPDHVAQFCSQHNIPMVIWARRQNDENTT